MASSGEDDCLPAICMEDSSTQRGSKRKSPETRGRNTRRRGTSNAPSTRKASQHKTTAAASQATKTTKNNSRGKRGRSRRTRTVASRPATNLETSVDVLILCSSDEESTSLQPSNTVTDTEGSKENRTDYANMSHNNHTDIVSEKSVILSDDDDDNENCTPLAGFDPNVTFSDSDSEDLYSVNHNEIKASAQEAAIRGFHEANQQEQYQQHVPARSTTSSKKKIEYVEDSDDDVRKLSPVPVSPASPEVSSIQLSARKQVKMSKRTLELLAKADRIGKTMDLDLDQSLNKSSGDIDLLFITQADSNPVITMTVKHGHSSFSKISIKKLEKFGSVYQQMAELHNVRFENVVLSLRDTILSADQTPADVGLTVADIVECGIIRRSGSGGGADSSQVASDNENTITLKFQCSQLRGSVLLPVNKFEKMAAVMQAYAEKKGESIKKYRFMFDGERLDPDETPCTLDLEGGECVDVFPA